MGTRIEPTISHQPGAGLTIDDIVLVPPGADNPGAAPSDADADVAADPTLAELAALENEVDNWLHPPAKAEPVTIAPEPASVEMRGEPAQPGVPPPPAPHRKRPVAWWLLGAAALAAVVGAAVLLDKPAEPKQALPPASTSTPAPSAAPAQAVVTQAAIPPAPAAPPASKPEMVFLEQPAAAAKATVPEDKPAAAEPAVEPQQPGTADSRVAEASKPVKARKAAAPKKAKPPKPAEPAPALAQRSQTWPPDRRGSDARRVEAARAACRARSSDPGACHIRVCDVLGSSHPACRE